MEPLSEGDVVTHPVYGKGVFSFHLDGRESDKAWVKFDNNPSELVAVTASRLSGCKKPNPVLRIYKDGLYLFSHQWVGGRWSPVIVWNLHLTKDEVETIQQGGYGEASSELTECLIEAYSKEVGE